MAAEESTSSDEAAPPEDYTPLFDDDDAFLDPAMMTGPVLTTITDITGVSTFFVALAALFWGVGWHW